MSMQDQLSQDLKEALKAKEQVRVDVLRMMKAAIQNKELELNRQLDDPEMTRVLTTMIKQRKEAAEQYEKANRADLAGKELQEVTIIEHYMPQALSEQELMEAIDAVIRDTGATTVKDLGAVMKKVMAQLAGHPVDGKRVNELVRAKLQ